MACWVGGGACNRRCGRECVARGQVAGRAG